MPGKSEKRYIIGTYRVQMTPDFGYESCAEIVPYLSKLGVSHINSSPYLQAAKGSTHGYDVVDHQRLNKELGGRKGHRKLITALKKCGVKKVHGTQFQHRTFVP